MKSFKPVFLMVLGMLVGLGGSGPVVGQTLKIATLSPGGSFWMTRMQEGADTVRQKTDQRVKIKYYPGGVMGDDRAVMRKMRIGQLHGGAVVSGSVSDAYPDCQVYGLPFVFESFDEVDHVRSIMDQRIIKGLEKGGLTAFGLAEGGFAYIMSQKPVLTVKDLQSHKVWAPNNDPMILDAAEDFGVKPIPLGLADVRAGLQTGLIDAVAAPPIGAVVLQWHTQVKYVMDFPFLYTYAVLAVDSRAFAKIRPEDRKVVRETLAKVFEDIDRQNRADNISAIETLKKQGIEFVVPSESQMADWKAKASEIPERMIESGRLSAEIVNEMRTILADYRSEKQ